MLDPFITNEDKKNLLHLATVTAKTDGDFERIVCQMIENLPHEIPGGDTTVKWVLTFGDGVGVRVGLIL